MGQVELKTKAQGGKGEMPKEKGTKGSVGGGGERGGWGGRKTLAVRGGLIFNSNHR